MSQSLTPTLDEVELPRQFNNASFLLAGQRRAWTISEGKLDLFLVRLEQEEPVGARYHVLRLEAGEAFFSLPQTADVGLLACPAPGSRLSELDLSRESGAEAGFSAGLLDLVEAWIKKLADALAGPILPKEAKQVVAGQTLKLNEETSSAVVSKESLVWISVPAGIVRLFAKDDFPPLAPESLFPLTRATWVDVPARCSVQGFDMVSWCALDPEWQHLDAFHHLVLLGFSIRRKQEEEREAQRLSLRTEADLQRISGALQSLAGPLEGTEDLPPGEATTSDPLVLACEAVGRALGVPIKAQAEVVRGAKQRDPIAAIAKTSGLRIRRVVLKDTWWKADGSPLLGIREADKRPIALLPSNAGTYKAYDPVKRTTEPVTAQSAAELSGFAYVFYRPFPPRKLSAGDLLSFGLRDCRSDLWTMIAMGVLSGLLNMLTPIFTGIIFDTMIPGAQRTELLQMGVILIASGICSALFSLVRSFALLRIEGKVDASVQAAVWDRLLSLPVPFFRDYTAGDLAARGMGIDAIRQTLTGSTLNSILSGIFSIFSFALLFYYSWRLALLATGLVAIAFLVSLGCGYYQVRSQRRISIVRGRLSGAILQFITGIAKFRISGTESRAFSAWAGDFSTQKGYAAHGRKVQNSLTVFNSAFPILCTAAIFFYTAKLMSDPTIDPAKRLTTGEFLAFNAAFGQFLTAALQLSASIISVLGIVPLYERAKPILEALPEVDEGKSDPGELTGLIEVNHLAFRYREDTPLVLRDVCLSIHPGEFVAFVGSSGCGKSTLFRLLLGFEKPESGSIYYDAQDIGSIDIQSVRRQIGVVLQNGKVLSGDIFTNIVGSAPLTVDDAWEAARMAGLDGDIRAMPMGLHTVIAEGGGGLSGGQRQRLMIARAIVGKPRILLFDEATSALDNHTQAIVSKSLESLKATRIVIAHRLSTIVKADRIFVFDKGVVVQCGTYEELIAQPGLFAELAKRQLT